MESEFGRSVGNTAFRGPRRSRATVVLPMPKDPLMKMTTMPCP
jgi:hypothetical protein